MNQVIDIKQIAERFAELKRQEKLLKTEIDGLKESVLGIFTEHEGQYNGGTFLLKYDRRDKWEYSPAISEMAEAMKSAKSEEVASGTAEKVQGTPFITFKDLS